MFFSCLESLRTIQGIGEAQRSYDGIKRASALLFLCHLAIICVASRPMAVFLQTASIVILDELDSTSRPCNYMMNRQMILTTFITFHFLKAVFLVPGALGRDIVAGFIVGYTFLVGFMIFNSYIIAYRMSFIKTS